jgi:hypothetical protein
MIITGVGSSLFQAGSSVEPLLITHEHYIMGYIHKFSRHTLVAPAPVTTVTLDCLLLKRWKLRH